MREVKSITNSVHFIETCLFFSLCKNLIATVKSFYRRMAISYSPSDFIKRHPIFLVHHGNILRFTESIPRFYPIDMSEPTKGPELLPTWIDKNGKLVQTRTPL